MKPTAPHGAYECEACAAKFCLGCDMGALIVRSFGRVDALCRACLLEVVRRAQGALQANQ